MIFFAYLAFKSFKQIPEKEINGKALKSEFENLSCWVFPRTFYHFRCTRQNYLLVFVAYSFSHRFEGISCTAWAVHALYWAKGGVRETA